MKPGSPAPTPQTGIRLDTLRRRTLYGLLAILVLSGAVWLFLHQARTDDAMPSPIEPWMMKAHGAAALLIVYLLGTMLYGHMVNAWQRQRNRGSGGTAAAALIVLALSGYGLYYFGGETLRRSTEWLHWIFGFASPVLLWWHIRRGRSWLTREGRRE
jgi:hypothetical protein